MNEKVSKTYTHQEVQNRYYNRLCQKYGPLHKWDSLTDTEKSTMRELKRQTRKEYFEAIREKGIKQK